MKPSCVNELISNLHMKAWPTVGLVHQQVKENLFNETIMNLPLAKSLFKFTIALPEKQAGSLPLKAIYAK